jgi:uncharacterized membrane protein YdjX (TVP38/TMEM64 family)
VKATRQDYWLKVVQGLAILVVFGVGYWQLARVGFDWRAVLEDANLWVFFLAMASLPVFGFPISACYIYAGLAFEPVEASLTCLGALLVNMSVSYVLTQTVLKTPILGFIERRGWSLPKLTEENEFRFIFLVRTIPGPPFFFQNLALGLAGVSFWTYLWVSMLGQGSIAVGVIFCTRYLSQDPLSTGGISGIAILIVLIIAKSIRAIKRKRLISNEASFEE